MRSSKGIRLLTTCAVVATLAAYGCGESSDKANGSDSGSAAQNDSGISFDTGGGGNADTGASAGDSQAAGGADATAADTSAAAGDTVAAPDTASTDTATAPDTGSPDTGSTDTGSTDTATAPDTGSTDTGSTDTATAPDTATTDAGGPDAGAPDAGAPDSGTTGPKNVVRFVAMGDTGTASEKQYKVGKVLAEHCKKHGCDFVLMLGDNFYDTGVDSDNDKQFVDKFEKPYKDVDAPFYVVLGNHDYGAGGAGAEFLKKEHYVKYGKKNPKWFMPDAYWNKQIKHVHLFAMDSNSMLYGDVLKFIVADQIKALDKAIAASKAEWKITFAHHPMRSNGPHGNAGCYEGAKAAPIPQLCGIIPVASGKGVLEAYNKLVCGRVDMHFAGHDHSRQWLDQKASTKHCKGVELIVSGGGAKTTDVATKSKGGYEFNPVHFQDAKTPGFFYAVIEDNKLTGSFIDMEGKTNFTRSYTK